MDDRSKAIEKAQENQPFWAQPSASLELVTPTTKDVAMYTGSLTGCTLFTLVDLGNEFDDCDKWAR